MELSSAQKIEIALRVARIAAIVLGALAVSTDCMVIDQVNAAELDLKSLRQKLGKWKAQTQ